MQHNIQQFTIKSQIFIKSYQVMILMQNVKTLPDYVLFLMMQIYF